MAKRLINVVDDWCDLAGIPADRRPDREALRERFPNDKSACRAGVSTREIASWEERHGFALPGGLKAWLSLSNGLFAEGPLIHPLSAIGPMILFARVPGLIVQPESWFELGNPNLETICIDLAYRRSEGSCPIFTSGDDERGSRPRIIAAGFDDWLLESLRSGGREYWFDADFDDLGDPWIEHVKNVPAPKLEAGGAFFAGLVASMLTNGVDERSIGLRLDLSQPDVEAIIRHLQHVPLTIDGSTRNVSPSQDLLATRPNG